MGRAVRRVRLTLWGRAHGLLLGLAGPVPHVDGSTAVFPWRKKGPGLKVQTADAAFWKTMLGRPLVMGDGIFFQFQFDFQYYWG